jgi:hypothetical protein
MARFTVPRLLTPLKMSDEMAKTRAEPYTNTRRLGSDLESCMTRNDDSRVSLTFPLHPMPFDLT